MWCHTRIKLSIWHNKLVLYTKHNETKKSEAVKDNFDWKIAATTLDVTDTEKKKITNRAKM